MKSYFGYSCDHSSIEAIINGPIFSSDATAVSDKNKHVRYKFGVEIEDALNWAEGLIKDRELLCQAPLFSQ